MRARFVQLVAWAVKLQKCWGSDCCPRDPSKCHRAEMEVFRSESHDAADDVLKAGVTESQKADSKLAACQWCGETPPADVYVSRSMSGVYNTASGRPEPGDLYFADWYPCADGGRCIHGWTNCDGHHLIGILPNGHAWDIDGRASNCTMPSDTAHRCWVRHGDPEKGEPVHVDKSGHTCAAGAGSIISGDYHGFLHGGVFTSC